MRLCGNFTENHTVQLTEMVKIIVITRPTPPNFFRSFASVLLTAESAILNQGQFLLLVSEILSSEHSLQNTVYHTVQKNKQSHPGFYQTGDKLSSNWLIRRKIRLIQKACLLIGTSCMKEEYHLLSSRAMYYFKMADTGEERTF